MDDPTMSADATPGAAVDVPAPPAPVVTADAPAPVVAPVEDVLPGDPTAARPDVMAIIADQEQRLEALEAKFAALEAEFSVEHSAATDEQTLGAKVSKLYRTIFGIDG